jgi:hypothetical protein
VVAIDFPSNLHTNDLLLSIWYAESAAAFDPSQDRARIANDTAWQSRYPNVFRTARFIPAVEPHRVPFALHGYAAGFSIIERVRYYHCAQYGRRTYGANMLTGNPCITLPAGIAAVVRQALLS